MQGEKKETALHTLGQCHDAKLNPFAVELLMKCAPKVESGRYVIDGGRMRILIEVDGEDSGA